jgi:hypothetical protein
MNPSNAPSEPNSFLDPMGRTPPECGLSAASGIRTLWENYRKCVPVITRHFSDEAVDSFEGAGL